MERQQRLYNVPDAHAAYGIPERHLRYMIAKRTIATVRVGRRVFLPGAELERLIREGTRAASNGGTP